MNQEYHKSTSKRDNAISASEVGQYKYCSISWLLQRRGFKPESKYLNSGTQKHIELGNQIDKSEKQVKISNLIAIIGYLFLIIAVTILIFEVIVF